MAPDRASRLYLAVAACAVVVYLGALWNRFAMDDLYIIANNPLVRSGQGIWRAFAAPYWPGEFGVRLYRPLVVASYAVDRLIDGPPWFHAGNLLWHAAASVAVAALARRLAGPEPAVALIAGLLFAVHPVHVEAVANVVGRAELMAGLFTVLAVWAALTWGAWGWSAAALACGLLSKENAAVTPALIVWGWACGIGRPATRRQVVAFAASWALVATAYLGVRWIVLHPFARLHDLAPVFVGQGPLVVRLTAVGALADIGRLLVFPLTLRADYSPNTRTAITTVLDGRFLLGVLAFLVWATLLVLARRRGRAGAVEAFGLGWVAIALLPVTNLVFPVGILVAERTLYLPSAGLALAVGAWGGGGGGERRTARGAAAGHRGRRDRGCGCSPHGMAGPGVARRREPHRKHSERFPRFLSRTGPRGGAAAIAARSAARARCLPSRRADLRPGSDAVRRGGGRGVHARPPGAGGLAASAG